MGHKKKKRERRRKKNAPHKRGQEQWVTAPQRERRDNARTPLKKTKQPKMGQEQWVTVPPPPLHYLVMSLMVTTQNSSAAASSKPWHMGSYRITQCIQVKQCDQDSRGSSIQMHSELDSSLVQKRPFCHIFLASLNAGEVKSCSMKLRLAISRATFTN